MTPKERAAMQQALEALEELNYSSGTVVAARMYESATAALREALKVTEDNISHRKLEQEPECKYKEAYIIWQDKTEWVQETAQPKELGMHRADVLRQRIENLQNAAPVRTKDLTDEEIEAIMVEQGDLRTTAFARAVIAADREKNK